MKEYDLISIGTGSAMHIVDAMLQRNPNLQVAVIDKDEPGGICLTRGCIPSKLLLYPAEMIRTIEKANEFGIDVQLHKIDFNKIMERMRHHINEEIDMIRNGLTESKNIDYYHDAAEFIEPYTLKLGGSNNNVTIRAKMIFLCTGSKPIIPPIKGLEDITYHTSDTILAMDRLPKNIAIVGGGYIGAEYGHFFSSMGSHITIVGRNKRFLPYEEAEISELAKRKIGKYMTIITNSEVIEVISSNATVDNVEADANATSSKESSYEKKYEQKGSKKKKLVIARDMTSGERTTITAEEVLIAAGRGPNTDILHPERAGIKTDENGWIVVNEYLETSQPNVWAFGDANGVYPFKHKANYEAELVYYNAVLGKKEEEKKKNNKVKKDYHAVPHAVFTYPEVAAVGLGEGEALTKYGENKILLGIARYEDTAKGIAMGIKDCFVKVIVKADDLEIIGAHIIGPHASVLIQEIINIMYTQHERTMKPILSAMHIHPSLSEVIQRSVSSLMPPQQYHHLITEHYGLSSD
ncbi:MAG TPA: dihydrolipoyl dehydrogenase [Nitrososphaeraceae archaeon]|nr:dihydrolipoyl dehydrogenase [Nitrososphaeraceae archaeon]